MPEGTHKPTLNNSKASVEDDLDDLDDVLDEFNPTSPTALPVPPNTSATSTFSSLPTTTTTRPRTNTRVDAPPKSIPSVAPLDAAAEEDEDALSAEFARELAKGMESLMKDITSSSAGGEAGISGTKGEKALDDDDEERAKAFKAAWEAMLVEGLDGKGGGVLAGLGEVLGEEGVKAKEGASKTEGGKEQAGGADFQSRLKKAMDKLNESEANLNPGTSSTGATPDSLDSLLASLKDLGLEGEGGEGEPDETELAGFLENMMGQLMSKEVLYEPLKELAESFPSYLSTPPAGTTLTQEDKTRYGNQLVCVKKIIAVFDRPGYDDKDEKSTKEIVDLMSEMQSYGSPPAELMGPLPPGLENMGAMGDGDCVIV